MNQESLVPNNDQKTTPEATNPSNPIASAQNFRPNPEELDNEVQRAACEAGCLLEPNPQQCLDDCAKRFPVRRE